jgi:uncharacterized OB-fold protein
MNTPRTLPLVTKANAHFWTSGGGGALQILRCTACGYWIHTPSPVCPHCLSAPAPQAVSGRGVVHTFTINVHPWEPGLDVPYIVAVVELVEQQGLRLTTNIVDCPPSEVWIGMPVEVVFEQIDDVYLPLFRPATDA